MCAMWAKRRSHTVFLCCVTVAVSILGENILPGVSQSVNDTTLRDSILNETSQRAGSANATIFPDGSETDGKFSDDEYANSDLPSNVTEECPADSLLPCVTKCCPFGQALGPNKRCTPSSVRFIPQFTILVNGFNDSLPVNETETMGGYNLVIQNICVNNRYRLEPFADTVDEFHLLYNGSLWLPEMKPHHIMMASNQYCMDVFTVGTEEIMLPLVCFINDTSEIKSSSFHFIIYPLGLLISVPFLLVTFLVHIAIPDLRNLHGKSLSCYTLCLAVAYIFLSVVQIGGQGFTTEVCISVAFTVQFTFIASFFWLNVLCFNTWRSVFFHEAILSHWLDQAKEQTYFLLFSIYAWSCTIIFIIVTMVMNFSPTIPSSYLKPSIGKTNCWFGTEKEAVPYFYGPIGALILTNVIMFIMTTSKLIYDLRTKQICSRTPKETFKFCLALFFMMGINWVMELISWLAGGPNFIWYITDICNALQGVVIFVVFVLDEPVWKLCEEKLWPRIGAYIPCCKNRWKDDPNESAGFQYDSVNEQVNTYTFPSQGK